MLAGGPPAPASPPLGQAPGAPPQMLAMMQYQQAMAAYMQQKQMLIMKAIDLLRQDKLRGFRIDIETDSTIQTDQNEEKESRTEFIKAVTGYVEQAFQIGAQAPEAVPMLGKMLLFGVRGFRAGRDLESTIEEFVDKMEKQAAQMAGQPKPPSPEVQKEQIALEGIRAKAQAEVEKAQTDAQASAQDNQREMASKQAEMALEREKMQLEMAAARQEFEFKQAEMAAKLREVELKISLAERDHAHKTEQMQMAHGHAIKQMEVGHAQHLEQLKAKPKKEAA